MKQMLIFTLIAICNFLSINAQDVINPPKFDFFTTSTGGYDTLMNRNANPFYLSWNWGKPGSKLDEALLMNGYHDFPFGSNDEKENMLIIQNTYVDDGNKKYFIVGGHNADVVLNAHCLHLEPTINVDSTDNFTPRDGDTTGAVFGWYEKDVGMNGLTGWENFDKFILYTGMVNDSALVLKNIWRGDILKWLDYDENFF